MRKESNKPTKMEIGQIKEAYIRKYAKRFVKDKLEQYEYERNQMVIRMEKEGIDVVKIISITGMSEEEIKKVLELR